MSMTREEAIALLNEQYETCKRIYDCSADQRKSYLGMALSALRPVSREQARRGEWEKIGADYRGQGGIWRCTECRKTYPYKCDFCPNCGAPMTDEAVEIRLKELEALKDGSTTD